MNWGRRKGARFGRVVVVVVVVVRNQWLLLPPCGVLGNVQSKSKEGISILASTMNSISHRSNMMVITAVCSPSLPLLSSSSSTEQLYSPTMAATASPTQPFRQHPGHTITPTDSHQTILHVGMGHLYLFDRQYLPTDIDSKLGYVVGGPGNMRIKQLPEACNITNSSNSPVSRRQSNHFRAGVVDIGLCRVPTGSHRTSSYLLRPRLQNKAHTRIDNSRQ